MAEVMNTKTNVLFESLCYNKLTFETDQQMEMLAIIH